MTFNSRLTEFAGLPVVEYVSPHNMEDRLRRAQEKARWAGEPVPEPSAPDPALAAALADPGSVAWRLADYPGFKRGSGPQAFLGLFDEFVEGVDADAVTTLVIGNVDGVFESDDEESQWVRDSLAAAAPRLPGLRSLFYVDVTYYECDSSWIWHKDLASLLAAYPRLTEFTVRGTGYLSLHVPRHDSLRRLTLQGGGLPGALAREVVSSGLPALEHLELWLGVENYGGDTTPEDLEPVLSGKAFPKLRSLGLRNAEHTGTWVRALAEAPVTTTLHTLDLSLGILRDEDAVPLLDAPVFHGLKRLDLHHHYLSKDMRARIRTALPGVEVDLSDPQEPDTERPGREPRYYTAVSE